MPYQRLFDSYAAATDGKVRIADAVAELMRSRQLKTVLDVGAGNGALARTLAESGTPVLAVEPNVEFARSWAEPAPRNLRFTPSRAQDLPEHLGPFDLALLSYVLDSMPADDVAEVCVRLQQLVRPGGALVGVTYADDSPWRRYSAAVEATVGPCMRGGETHVFEMVSAAGYGPRRIRSLSTTVGATSLDELFTRLAFFYRRVGKNYHGSRTRLLPELERHVTRDLTGRWTIGIQEVLFTIDASRAASTRGSSPLAASGCSQPTDYSGTDEPYVMRAAASRGRRRDTGRRIRSMSGSAGTGNPAVPLVRTEQPVTVAVVPSTEAVSTVQWDSLVDGRGFYAGPAWARSLELTHEPSPLLVAKQGDRVAAVLPTWTPSRVQDELFSLPSLMGGLPGPWLRPFLWLGGRRVTTGALACVRGRNRPRVLGELLTAAVTLARRLGLAGVVWPYLAAAEAREISDAHPGANAVLHTAGATLPVPPGGTRELAAAATRHDRRTWAYERRKFAATGAVVQWRRPPSWPATLPELLARTRMKYGAEGGHAELARVLTNQERAGVASSALVGLVRVGEDVRAATVFYRHLDQLHGRYWGAAASAPPFAYYALNFYAAVDWAADHGVSHLNLSVSAWEAKVRRGARLHPLALVVATAVAANEVPTQQMTVRHNKAVARTWVARFAARPGALTQEWNDWA